MNCSTDQHGSALVRIVDKDGNDVSMGGGTPGGSSGQLQYNNGSSFGGIPIATYVGGVLTFGDPTLVLANNAVVVDPVRSYVEVDGNAGLLLRPSSSAGPGFSMFDGAGVGLDACGRQLVFQGNEGSYSVFDVGTANAGLLGNPLALSQFALWPSDMTVANSYWQFAMQNSPDYGGVVFIQDVSGGSYPQPLSLQAGWDQASTPTQLVLNPDGSVYFGSNTDDGSGRPFQFTGDTSFNGDTHTTGDKYVGGELFLTSSANFASYTNMAPSDGDIWYDGNDFKARIGGVTKTIQLV